MREVTLMEMLDAREKRACVQQSLIQKYKKPIICFTMNIAGPVKDSDTIRQGYSIGREMLEQRLRVQRIQVLHFEQAQGVTGSEAIYVVDAKGASIKKMTCEIEEASGLGRLFDMDVIAPDGEKYERTAPRKCLICGGQAQVCARSRIHSVAELQAKTAQILNEAITSRKCDRGAEMAVRSLLYEVAATPKPGLVDRDNSGSHRDMDFFSFLSSAAALQPYFRRCVCIGAETAEEEAAVTFEKLRIPGKEAEGQMYRATGGVNTHKGAIFSLGIVCGALGRLSIRDWQNPERILQECAAMTQGVIQKDFAGLTKGTASTVGQRLYLDHGITGVRGQAEAGFPAVRDIGLPKLEEGLKNGLSINEAACVTLAALIAGAVDTNLINRSDYATQQKTAEHFAQLLEKEPFPAAEALRELDDQFIKENLSPGGSADLLALTLLLHFLKEEN